MACEKYGIKSSLNDYEERYFNSHGIAIAKGYIAGFDAHKELVKDKLFTVEDIRKAWNAAYIDAMSLDEENYKPLFFEDFLQSLLPKTEWGVEFDEQGKLKLI